MGHFSKQVLTALENTDLVLLEANHDVGMLKSSSYPNILKQRILGKNGHLSNESAADACLELVNGNVSGIILGHLSQENNTEELAYATVLKHLTENGVKVGQDLAMGIAFRNKLSGNFFV
jgi:phosphoribosyl 1,2-cyclic phosphodiesterase